VTRSLSGKRIAAFVVFSIATWIGLLFAISPLDLPLSIAVFDRNAAWAGWIARYGTLPGTVVFIASIAFLLSSIPRRSPCRVLPSVQKMSIALIIMGLLHPLGITTVIKALVGRPRFVQLEGDYSLFTPFFEPGSILQGVSFPSGHVATAAAFFPAAYVLFRSGHRRLAATVFGLTAGWAVFTAAARIVAGAHYLTDTFFSLGLALLLSPLVGNAAMSLWSLMFDRIPGKRTEKVTSAS